MLAILVWLERLSSLVPPVVRRTTVLVVSVLAIGGGLYLLGECHGKSAEHERVFTDSLHAVIEARSAVAHEAKADAQPAVDTAAIQQRAVKAAIARFTAARQIIHHDPIVTADSDSVRVGYADGRDTVMHALPPVIVLIRDLSALNARKDSLLGNATFILTHQVPAALQADSVAIRKLTFALNADDSLVVALRQQNIALAKMVAHLQPNALDKALRVATWGAVLYGAAKVYQAVR